MKNLIAILIVLFAAQTGFGQDFICFNRDDVEKKFSEIKEKLNPGDTGKVYLNDSIHKMVITKTGYDKMELVYSFNKFGASLNQQLTFYCDSCLDNYLDIILNNQDIRWIKVEDNQFISKKKFSVLINKKGTTYTCGLLQLHPKKTEDFKFIVTFNLIQIQRNKWKELVKHKN
jgi:hypothetical protein